MGVLGATGWRCHETSGYVEKGVTIWGFICRLQQQTGKQYDGPVSSSIIYQDTTGYRTATASPRPRLRHSSARRAGVLRRMCSRSSVHACYDAFQGGGLL